MLFPTCRATAGLVLLIASAAAAQTLPAETAPATSPAASTSAPANKPKFDDLLAGKKAGFDFEDTPVNAVIDAVGKSYGVEIENNYQKDERGNSTPVITDLMVAGPTDKHPVPRITAKVPGEITAREALGIVNASIMPYGFVAMETVRLRDDAAHTPYGVITIVAVRKDAGASRPVFYGMDPDKIPEGDDIRTQVIALKNLDLTKARDVVASVLAKNADITLNADRKTLIITDTATHVHSAVTVLQILENQAPK